MHTLSSHTLSITFFLPILPVNNLEQMFKVMTALWMVLLSHMSQILNNDLRNVRMTLKVIQDHQLHQLHHQLA